MYQRANPPVTVKPTRRSRLSHSAPSCTAAAARITRDRAFACGFAIAVVSVLTTHDEPKIAYDIMYHAGFTPADFERAGIDVSDLRLIRRLWRDHRGERAARAATP